MDRDKAYDGTYRAFTISTYVSRTRPTYLHGGPKKSATRPYIALSISRTYNLPITRLLEESDCKKGCRILVNMFTRRRLTRQTDRCVR